MSLNDWLCTVCVKDFCSQDIEKSDSDSWPLCPICGTEVVDDSSVNPLERSLLRRKKKLGEVE